MAKAEVAETETKGTVKAAKVATSLASTTIAKAATKKIKTVLNPSGALRTNSRPRCKFCSKNGSMIKVTMKRRRRMRVLSNP